MHIKIIKRVQESEREFTKESYMSILLDWFLAVVDFSSTSLGRWRFAAQRALNCFLESGGVAPVAGRFKFGVTSFAGGFSFKATPIRRDGSKKGIKNGAFNKILVIVIK